MWEKQSVRDGCNTDGYLDKLESIQEQLELCKKSLADFLDGRRRQFPRYYFVSEADLLDILSNGSDPYKILVHTPKVGGLPILSQILTENLYQVPACHHPAC